MSSITYGVSEEVYAINEERRVSYGIVAYADSETDGTATIVASERDVSSKKSEIEDLVRKCNELKLSLLHFFDVVEDFLVE